MWEGILQEASAESLSLSSSPFLYFKAIFQMPDAQLDLMDSIPLRAKEGGKQFHAHDIWQICQVLLVVNWSLFPNTTCFFRCLWNNQKSCHFCNKLEPLKAFILTWQFWNISKDLLGLRPWIELEDKPRRTMENAALTQTGSTLIPLRRKSAEENRKDGVTYF